MSTDTSQALNAALATALELEQLRPIQVLQLQPGDVLLLSCPQLLMEEQKIKLESSIRPHLPNGQPIVILDSGIKVAALRSAMREGS